MHTYVRWHGAKAASTEQSRAPAVQEEFADGGGEHEDICAPVTEQKDIALLSGWCYSGIRYWILLTESTTQEAK